MNREINREIYCDQVIYHMFAVIKMARSANSLFSLRRMIFHFSCIFVLFPNFPVASPSRGRRLICWQAIMKCQGEPECDHAYQQYNLACAPVINGERTKCPRHCIASVIQLNLTKNGPLLEDCDCATDIFCKSAKRAIEPCLPRTSNMGCTEARRRCERDAECRAAMREYLIHCSKLFDGVRCTDACMNVIANMRKIPKAEQLDTCICDGTERIICEYVKINMNTLCFGSHRTYDGSGLPDSEEDHDGIDEDANYQLVGSAACPENVHCILNLVALVLVFVSRVLNFQ